MDPITFYQRIKHKNPLHPYSWLARYKNGGGLKQFDFDGYHHSREINLAQVTEIEILGHADSPIKLPVPYSDRQPDEVVLKAQVSLHQTLGQVGMTRTVKCFFGYRFGDEKFLVEIDEDGKVWKTNNEDEGGSLVVTNYVVGQADPLRN